MDRNPLELERVQRGDVQLMGPKDGFVRTTNILSNDPDILPHASCLFWVEKSSSEQSGSENHSDDGADESDKTSSSASKYLKTSRTTSRPRKSGIGSQPSTSRAKDPYKADFDPSNIDPKFVRYCAVVNGIFEGRKYWQMRLTVKNFNAEVKDEVHTLCEVGLAPTHKFKTQNNSLVYSDNDVFAIKIGKGKTHWRALEGYKFKDREWVDLCEAKKDENKDTYSLTFGLFLDSPYKKIVFYTVDDPKIRIVTPIEYDKGYPIFSLGESEMSNVATVSLETETAEEVAVISELAKVHEIEGKDTTSPLGSVDQ